MRPRRDLIELLSQTRQPRAPMCVVVTAPPEPTPPRQRHKNDRTLNPIYARRGPEGQKSHVLQILYATRFVSL